MRCGWYTLAAAALLLQAALPASATSDKLSPQDALYYNGFFTWTGGPDGGIVWNNWFAPTQPKTAFPAMSSFADYYQSVENWRSIAESRGGSVPAPFKFVSDPVPQTLQVNQTRMIYLNMTAAASASYFFEIWLSNGVFVAGAPQIAPGKPQVPSQPVQTCGVTNGVRMLRPETAVIPRGVRLEIRVYPIDFCTPQFVTNPQFNRGSISIPYLSAQDFAIRSGEGAKNDAPAKANAAGLWSLGPGGLAVLGLIPAGRRRAFTTLSIILLVSVCFSGCFSHARPSAAAPTAGFIDSKIVDAAPGLGASIYGDVRDLVGRPIRGVHVSVIGTGNATLTDTAGGFHMEDVAVGTHSVRFDKLGMRSIEKDEVIDSAKTTILHVVMEPANLRGPDAIPHAHDMWNGRDVVTIFDDSVAIGSDGSHCKGSTSNVTCESKGFGLPNGTKDLAYNIVLPGTSEVEATISWDGGQVYEAGIEVHSAADPLGSAASACPAPRTYIACPPFEFMAARTKGQVTHILVGPEMMDNGHARWSQWAFKLYVPAFTFDADIPLPSAFHVVLKIHRGVLPLEPGHRDFWDGAKAVPVVDYVAPSVGWIPHPLMPPETRWIDVVLEQSYSTHKPWTVNFTTAAYKATERGVPMNREYKREPLRVEYRQALCLDEQDEFYQTVSRWNFVLRAAQYGVEGNLAQYQDNVDAYSETSDSGVGRGTLDYRLTVIAHRDSPGPDDRVLPAPECAK